MIQPRARELFARLLTFVSEFADSTAGGVAGDQTYVF
jgi:hypothetical protein